MSLKVKGVYKNFGSFIALNNIDIEIKKGEFVCFLGPSGCGKTTLLRIIAGLEEAAAGKIELDGKDITYLHPSKRNFGIVFQSYALFPNMTIEQNIAFGLKNKGLKKEILKEEVMKALEMVGLSGSSSKYPHQLSGGQQQRVALARALALRPDVLLLDEPLSALDAKVRAKLRIDIKELQEKTGITTIMVTHDQEEALTMADKIIVMKNSEVVQVGTPKEIYEKPKNIFVADFVGDINFIPKENGKMLAIRPEHIQIVSHLDEGAILSTLVEWEYFGNGYRLILNSFGDKIICQINSIEANYIQLVKGMNLFIKMDKQHYITYQRGL